VEADAATGEDVEALRIETEHAPRFWRAISACGDDARADMNYNCFGCKKPCCLLNRPHTDKLWSVAIGGGVPAGTLQLAFSIDEFGTFARVIFGKQAGDSCAIEIGIQTYRGHLQ